jgi:hypothetical protein
MVSSLSGAVPEGMMASQFFRSSLESPTTSEHFGYWKTIRWY